MAQEGTQQAVWLAQNADKLDVDVPIAGVPFHVEGAANLPKELMMVEKAKLSTSAFIELDRKGELQVTLKRGLFKSASEISLEIEFDRTEPLESMEVIRERANEELREEAKRHSTKVTIDGIEQELNAEQEENDGRPD